MLHGALALAVALAAALDLAPGPEVSCPSAAAVQVALARLGVQASRRSGRADWGIEGNRLRLRVQTRTASRAEPQLRDLPLAACDDLTEALAYAIERATAPLGEPPPAPKRARGMSDGGRERPSTAIVETARALEHRDYALALHLGPRVLFSAPSLGLELGAERFWGAGVPRLGVAIALGAALPTTHTLRIAPGPPPSEALLPSGQLAITRLWASLGPGIELLDFGERARAGASIEGLVELAIANPSGSGAGSLRDPVSARDARIGGRGQVWITVRFGSFELRAAAGVRGLQSKSYRVIPAIPPLGVIATLPALEAEASLGVGLTFGGEGRSP